MGHCLIGYQIESLSAIVIKRIQHGQCSYSVHHGDHMIVSRLSIHIVTNLDIDIYRYIIYIHKYIIYIKSYELLGM